jgi:hypothetical protein
MGRKLLFWACAALFLAMGEFRATMIRVPSKKAAATGSAWLPHAVRLGVPEPGHTSPYPGSASG